MKRFLLSITLLAALLFQPGRVQRGLSMLPDNEQPAPQSPSAERYTIADLGTLGGASEAFAISDNGLVAGRYATGSGYTYQAFLWEDGVMQGLGTLGGDSSEAYGVNDSGQVVGVSKNGSSNTHAFLWQNGSMQDLGTLGGSHSGALEINNSGQVAGWATRSDYRMHAVLWSGGISDLGALDWDSYAIGVNESGQVVGFAHVGTVDPWDMNPHAFRWTGSMQDLGTLGWAGSVAHGINDNGDVVGYLINANRDDWHAFLSQGGGMQDLGGTLSFALDINNAGLIVGESGGHAVLWENGQLKDLNTLIPADSGWVLNSARAINNKGQIVGYGTLNGQTRAFLVSPRAYYWTNPSGGSWHLTTNWDPQGDPGDGDTVIFELSGQYTVDASAVIAAAAPAANFPVGRMIVAGTNTVDFQNLALNLLDDSVTEPALTVNDGGTVKITSGAGDMIHALIGGAPPANPANPPIARLQVFNNGTSLNGTGRLSIGGEGAGDLFVANGGQLTSAEARLGGLLTTAPGTAVVGGDGSLWQTGNIAVGYGVSGTLTIENGGRVDSNDAFVSIGIISEDSQVTVDGVGAGSNQPSMWALLGDLTVGQTNVGYVDVLNGGQLAVNKSVYVTDGILKVDGSYLSVLENVWIGGGTYIYGSDLLMAHSAEGDIYGDFFVGHSGPGFVTLDEDSTTGLTVLSVKDPQAGQCAIGWHYDGEVVIKDRSILDCRNIFVGQTGALGTGTITLDGGLLSASQYVWVGDSDLGAGGLGWVTMSNEAVIVAGQGMTIGSIGAVLGTGDIFVGTSGLDLEGALSPGIITHTAQLAPGAAESLSAGTSGSTATLTISGTLTISPTGRLEIPLVGSNPGQYGSLAVTGAADLDGVLALKFSQSFAPKQGDIFTFLTAAGGIRGTFSSVEISGLAPGFEYDLTIIDGQVKLEALNDGVPLRMLFLPLVVR